MLLLFLLVLDTDRVFSVEIQKEFLINGYFASTLVSQLGFASGGTFSYEAALIYPINGNNSSQFNSSWRWTPLNIWLLVLTEFQKESWYDDVMWDYVKNSDPDLCVAPSYARFELTNSLSGSIKIQEDGLFTILLLSCYSENQSITVDLTVRTNNLTPNGLQAHLPIESLMLPYLYCSLSFIYVGLFIAWALDCFRRKRFLKHIHMLLTLAVSLKVASEILTFLLYKQMSGTGNANQNLKIAQSFTAGYCSAAFLFSLLLISLGWTITRPRLKPKEGRWVAIVFVLYLLMCTLLSTCGNSMTTIACRGYVLGEYVVGSMLMLFTIVAVNFNIHRVRLSLSSTPWNAQAAVLYYKLEGYKSFRWCFIAYILLPTFMLVMKSLILSWQYTWLGVALNEFCMLLIYVHTGMTFAPFNECFLTRAFDGTYTEL